MLTLETRGITLPPSTFTECFRRFARIAGPLFVLAASIVGCSLSEYEEAMKFQQDKAKYFDEQTQNTTKKSIDWPDKPKDEKEAKEAIAENEIYFRPYKD